MRHDHGSSTWVDPGGDDDAARDLADEGAASTHASATDAHEHGAGPSEALAEPPVTQATAGPLPPSESPLGFSLEGLSDPDPVRREAAWLQFHSCFYETLMEALRRYEQDYDRRSDITQRVFIRAHRAIVVNGRPLRDARKALPWLKKIGRNLCHDVSDADAAVERMMGIHGSHMLAQEGLQAHAENALDRLGADDSYDDGRFPISAEKFRARVAALSERDQKILRLRTGEELEWDAVAEQVGMTAESVRQRFHRLRERLRRA